MSQRKSHEQFIRELQEINPDIEPLDQYTGAVIKMRLKCRICRNIWDATPHDLLSGHGCPECGKRKVTKAHSKTHEQFIKELREVNPEIEPLEQYTNSATRMRLRCRICGNIWATRPATLLCGRGCPECGKRKVGKALKKTHEQFVAELKTINPNIEVLESYSGDRVKLSLHCLKCGNIWNSAPHDLLRGHGCPKCGYERQRDIQRRTHTQFLEDLKKVNPDIELIDKYINNHTRVHFRCAVCNRVWKTVPNSVLSGHGCPSCARSSTSFFEQVILQAFQLCLGENAVITRDRSAIGMELDVFIPELHVAFEPGSWRWHQDKQLRDKQKREKCREKGICLVAVYTDYKLEKPPFNEDCYVYPENLGLSNWKDTQDIASRLLNRYGLSLSDVQWERVKTEAFEMSKSRTHEEFLDLLHKKNPNILVKGHYSGNTTKLECECKICGHIWNPVPSSILLGHGCPRCAKIKTSNALKTSHEDFIERLKIANPNIEVTGIYENSKEKIGCKCALCGNEWQMIPNNLLRGQGCPKCGKVKAAASRRRTHEQFIAKLTEKNDKVYIIGRYVDSKTKVLAGCKKCGYEWEAIPSSILSGRGCPKCGNNLKKTHDQFAAEMREAHPEIEILGKYQGANKKMNFICRNCGHTWYSRPQNMLYSRGCPVCRHAKSDI